MVCLLNKDLLVTDPLAFDELVTIMHKATVGWFDDGFYHHKTPSPASGAEWLVGWSTSSASDACEKEEGF